MKIAVLGTRGIPANYSGFETCVQETAYRFRDSGHLVRVYCRRGKSGGDLSTFDGIELVNIPFVHGKHIETPSHSFLSLLHAIAHPVDVVHVYGAGNGWCVPILSILGMRVVFLVDGLDWARAKWGRFARLVLRWGVRIGSKFADNTIADSLHVMKVISLTFPGRDLQYVPYGARLLTEAGEGKLKDLGLEKNGYYLFVGRFVPEKNVHILVSAFEQTQTRRKLVLVGGNSYDASYEDRLRSTTSQSIIFPGFVFGEAYNELLFGCYAYIQPSALEGTSPSLLAAMGAGACVLVSDIPENQETVGDAGFYFESNNVADLSKKINLLDKHPTKVAQKRTESLDRVRRHTPGMLSPTISCNSLPEVVRMM